MTTLLPHIFVASSVEYEPLYVDKLINNLRALGNVPLDHVHVVVGGCEKEMCTVTEDGVTIDRVMYRCFEFTPMIFVAKNPDRYDFEYAFFTHDTVDFGSRFYPYMSYVVNKMKEREAHTAPIEAPAPSMNMGIYHKEAILECTDVLESLCINTNDYGELWAMKNKLMVCLKIAGSAFSFGIQYPQSGFRTVHSPNTKPDSALNTWSRSLIFSC